VKFEIKVMILSASLILISVSLASIEPVLAQSDNTLGQDGDGNEASQSDESSQDSNQNNMCVSGESTSLSCINLSSENAGSGQDEQGPAGPQSVNGKIYYAYGNNVAAANPAISDASCREGDSLISGSYNLLIRGDASNLVALVSGPNGNDWHVLIGGSGTTKYDLNAIAICFDNDNT